jgi:hypothetical protein
MTYPHNKIPTTSFSYLLTTTYPTYHIQPTLHTHYLLPRLPN